jgi:hypothetical protein
MLFKPFGKHFLHDYPRLGKAVHAFFEFHSKRTIQGGNVKNFVVCNDILRHVGELQTHVFVSCHWSVEVEIFDIHCEEFCSGCGDDAIDEQFHGDKVGGWCAGIARIVHPVLSHD